MSAEHSMLSESVARLFADMGDRPAAPLEQQPGSAWARLQDAGVTDLLVPEAAGGFGGSWQDAFVVFNLAGVHAIALPIGETIVARWMLVTAGIDVPGGAATFGVADNASLQEHGATGEWRFSGELLDLPCGNSVESLVALCRVADQDYVVLLSTAAATQVHIESNEADEPRIRLHFADARVLAIRALDGACAKAENAGALLRTAQISGALEAALQLSVQHAGERVQFGKPIGKFQAIQQQLAVLAEETAAVKCAALAACRAADLGDARFEIAAAKLRANRAVGQATPIAHEVHGAIGITQEHRLHRFTQRLWSWRTEFGNDRYWASELGRLVLAQGADVLWTNLTARGDR